MVKKNFVVPVLIGALLAVAMMTGCAGLKPTVIWDESLPAEDSALLIVNYLGKITAYNSVSVDWGLYTFPQIPAGDAEFVCDVNAGRGYTHFNGYDLIFRCHLEPGKIYSFWFTEQNEKYGVALYSWDLGETIGIMNDKAHYVEFVLFLNAKK